MFQPSYYTKKPEYGVLELADSFRVRYMQWGKSQGNLNFHKIKSNVDVPEFHAFSMSFAWRGFVSFKNTTYPTAYRVSN